MITRGYKPSDNKRLLAKYDYKRLAANNDCIKLGVKISQSMIRSLC